MGIGTYYHMMALADVAARHSSGPSAPVPSPRRPRSPASAPRNGTGPPAVREPRRMLARRDTLGRAWAVRAGRAGWMGRTCDTRKEIAFSSHLGGAGRAHVEGEWLGLMFRAEGTPGIRPGRPRSAGRGRGRRTWVEPSPHHRNRTLKSMASCQVRSVSKTEDRENQAKSVRKPADQTAP